jgi:hypothetical protein
MAKNITATIIVVLILSINGFSQQTVEKKIYKTNDDDNSKYTNVGNIGLTVTNFGTYGHGFSLWPDQPSCEFPLGSGIEHIFDGGLWIGGFIGNDKTAHVTTGAVDAASVSSKGGGFEFTNAAGTKVAERSSLLESKFFSPLAISHQDFVMDYTDTNKTYLNGEIIEDHWPLGVAVHQECYTWDYSFANFFVIMNYWIKNVSQKEIDSVYVGLWTDPVVRNTNVTSPRSGSTFFSKGGDGYKDSLKIAYEFDATGDIGFTDSYVGFQYLGSKPSCDKAHYVSWQYKNTSDPDMFAPTNDVSRYEKMQGYFSYGKVFGNGINASSLKLPSNRSELITAGPFAKIAPGDSINVVYAIVCAKKYGSDAASIDNEEQKTNLYKSASWALRAYNGEDKNGNGVLDPGEDMDGNGVITRYILPAPPATPKLKVIPGNQNVTLYWDRKAESSIDPISSKKDFEGYRIYRTNPGYDLTESQNILTSLVKIGEFDSTGNKIGFNTGFSKIRLAEPVTFEGDTTKYWYKFEINNQLNGWQYIYSVTSFDKGDAANNLESLESSPLANANKVIPGSTPTSQESVEVGVYPNPYYGKAYWDGSAERLRKIYFYNLPAECDITIYTLAGDIVKRMHHDQSSNGSELGWFSTYSKDGTQKMSGGEHAWDLISNSDQAIASGLYLFTVKDSKTGNIKKGKFLVVK